jgi:hypothetical protein
MRFRTIQVRPKDVPAVLRQAEHAVNIARPLTMADEPEEHDRKAARQHE